MSGLNLKSGQVSGEVVGYQFKIKVLSGIALVSDVKDAMEAAGLPTRFLITPSSRKAMGRAANETAKTGGRFKDHLARRVCDKVDRSVVAIVDETVDVEAEELTYDSTTTITLDKETASVSAEGKLAEEFHQKYETYLGGVTGTDIRHILYRIVKSLGNAIGLCDRGHLYFIPEKKAYLLEQIEDFLSAMGLGRVYATEILDSEASQEWVWDAAQQNVRSRVRLIMRGIETKKRAKSFEKSGVALEGSKELMDLYAELTGYSAETEDLLSEIAAAENTVASLAQDAALAKVAS